MKIVGYTVTSPDFYGGVVGFLSLGGANFAKGGAATAALEEGSYAAKTFENIIQGAKNITKKGALETNVVVDGSVSEAFGGIMAKYGKKVDDLSFKVTKDGSAFSFTSGNETFTLYTQKSVGNFVENTISKTVIEGAKKTTTKG